MSPALRMLLAPNKLPVYHVNQPIQDIQTLKLVFLPDDCHPMFAEWLLNTPYLNAGFTRYQCSSIFLFFIFLNKTTSQDTNEILRSVARSLNTWQQNATRFWLVWVRLSLK